MRSIQGQWAKAWGGYLAHFWTEEKKTLCGKTHLVPCRYGDWHTRARSKCKKCLRKYHALRIEREKETTQ